ncbi:hypothetical protein C8J57DRAFT_1234100 [Mycena rebaudengoi]|nr:hypothetical protein C8J57DRAFT_1234100 [Mycena rebaudengoi]
MTVDPSLFAKEVQKQRLIHTAAQQHATAGLRRFDPRLVDVQKGGEDGSRGATASSWELKHGKLRTERRKRNGDNTNGDGAKHVQSDSRDFVKRTDNRDCSGFGVHLVLVTLSHMPAGERDLPDPSLMLPEGTRRERGGRVGNKSPDVTVVDDSASDTEEPNYLILSLQTSKFTQRFVKKANLQIQLFAIGLVTHVHHP